MTTEVSRHPGTRASSATPYALLNLHGLTSPETTSGASWILEATAVEPNDKPVECLFDDDGCDVKQRVDAAAAQDDEDEVAEPVPVQMRVGGLLEHANGYCIMRFIKSLQELSVVPSYTSV
jgi:hypothetical protein